MRQLFQRISEWMMYPRKSDRDAARRSDRFLRAFMEGDREYVAAEVVRHAGADFFALMAQSDALWRRILHERMASGDD